MQAVSLLQALGNLEDPRAARGVRHSYSAIVALALLGMLARIREMEVLVHSARTHWDELREPLGFTREEPPVATTISRTLALCSVADVQAVFLTWLQTCREEFSAEGVVAVDGKTAKQVIDSNGRPLHMLLRRPDVGVVSHDVHYYVTSLDPDAVTAADLLRWVRGHWQIENSLHFLKDRWWDEDRHHTRRPGISAVMAGLNSIALSIHRLSSDSEQPVRASADQIAWQPSKGLQIMLA